MATEPNPSTVDGLTPPPQIDSTDRDFFPSPALLDCGDLAETFRVYQAAAIHLLMTLTPTQLKLQALTYAVYLNERHALDLDMDDILAGWQRGLGFDTRSFLPAPLTQSQPSFCPVPKAADRRTASRGRPCDGACWR